MILDHVNARDVFTPIYASDTNHGHVMDNPENVKQVEELAEFFNKK